MVSYKTCFLIMSIHKYIIYSFSYQYYEITKASIYQELRGTAACLAILESYLKTANQFWPKPSCFVLFCCLFFGCKKHCVKSFRILSQYLSGDC